MQKGKTGITFKAYAAIGFAMAMVGWTVPLIILAGIVWLYEKDEQTSVHVLQALLITVVSSIIGEILYLLRLNMISVSPLSGWGSGVIYTIVDGWRTVLGVLSFIVDILFIILALMGLLGALKGNDVNLPIVGGFARKAFGLVQKAAPQYAPPQQAQQPVQPQYNPVGQQAPQAPVQPQYNPSGQAAPQAPVQPQVPGQPPTNYPPAGQ